MLFGNIWLPSALIVTAIFSASAIYKSYSDIQEAQQIQENYEIISEIKTLLAKQYNKNPEEVTRDEIITNLSKGENWEKIFLLDRDKNSDLSNKELVNTNGKFEISGDEKLKLLVLKAMEKNITDVSKILPINNKYIFESGKLQKNMILKDNNIEDSINKAIHFLAEDLLYSGSSVSVDNTLTSILEEFTPYDELYQDFRNTGEVSLSPSELKIRQKKYFKAKIIEKLFLNETAIEAKLYPLLKDK